MHSVGILLESQYKGVDGSFAGVLQGLAKGWGLVSRGNRLAPPNDKEAQLTYERMNRDTAISVASTFAEVQREAKKTEAPFVFVSSADIMRPLVSARYAGAKREAEAAIAELSEREDALRPVFMRPGTFSATASQAHLRRVHVPPAQAAVDHAARDANRRVVPGAQAAPPLARPGAVAGGGAACAPGTCLLYTSDAADE